jgi:hypothetical protein
MARYAVRTRDYSDVVYVKPVYRRVDEGERPVRLYRAKSLVTGAVCVAWTSADAVIGITRFLLVESERLGRPITPGVNRGAPGLTRPAD